MLNKKGLTHTILSESYKLNSQRVKKKSFVLKAMMNKDISKMGRVDNYWENIYIP